MHLREISPIDGRYADKLAPLRDYLSEWALVRYRILVEARWLMTMAEEKAISHLRSFSTDEKAIPEYADLRI